MSGLTYHTNQPEGAVVRAPFTVTDRGIPTWRDTFGAMLRDNAGVRINSAGRLESDNAILLATAKSLGPTDDTDYTKHATGSSWTLRVNNVNTIIASDTTHDFGSKATQNHERAFCIGLGESFAKNADSWLKGPASVQFGTSEGVPMPFDFEIFAVSARLNVTVDTSGDLDARLYIENVVQAAAELTWDSAAGTGFATQYVTGLSISGNEGDRVTAGMFKSNTMTWDDVTYWVWFKGVV